MSENVNFINQISDTQGQLNRCKELLVAIWHQELDGMSQPRIKLQMKIIQSKLDDVQKVLELGLLDK